MENEEDDEDDFKDDDDENESDLENDGRVKNLFWMIWFVKNCTWRWTEIKVQVQISQCNTNAIPLKSDFETESVSAIQVDIQTAGIT